MKVTTSAQRSKGFLLMEVVIALFIFTVVATSYTKALNSLWRNTTFVKEELVITQILDSALRENLYLQTLTEGSFETYVPEREITLVTQVTPLELENEEGVILQQMWEVVVTANYEQDDREEERSVRGWRYIPLYNR